MKVFYKKENLVIVPQTLLFDSISNDAKVWYMYLSLEKGDPFNIEWAAKNLGMTIEQVKSAHEELLKNGWIRVEFDTDILLMRKYEQA